MSIWALRPASRPSRSSRRRSFTPCAVSWSSFAAFASPYAFLILSFPWPGTPEMSTKSSRGMEKAFARLPSPGTCSRIMVLAL